MSYRPKLIGRMAFDYSGYLGPIKEFKPKPAKFCGLVEDAAPTHLMTPKQFTKFTPFTKPKDQTMTRDDETSPADDLQEKIYGYLIQAGADEVQLDDFRRLWAAIHKRNNLAADSRRRRAFNASTTASLAKMFPDYNRLGK